MSVSVALRPMRGLALPLVVVFGLAAGYLPLPGPSGQVPVAQAAAVDDAAAHAALEAVAKAPLAFEPEPDGRSLLAAGPGYSVRVDQGRIEVEPAGIRLGFGGGLPEPTQALGSQASYFLGDQPDQWRTGVPQFAAVRLPAVAPGIDLLVHSESGALRFDHILAPGADGRSAGFTVTAPQPPVLTSDGRLDLGGGLILAAPYSYQDLPSGRVAVASAFAPPAQDGQSWRIRYVLGSYDPAWPLVIDPILRHASFLGSSQTDYGQAVAAYTPSTGSATWVYIAGYQVSKAAPSSFSTQYAHSGTFGATTGFASNDAFVARVDYDHLTKVATPRWFAHLGGTLVDQAYGAAVDANGNVAVVGYAYSQNFPVANALLSPTDTGGVYDGSVRSDPACNWPDPFVTLLSSSGNTLVFSSYLGGGGDDWAFDVDFDPSGFLVVSGGVQYNYLCQSSEPFPLRNAAQLLHGDTGSTALGRDAFVAKVNLTKSPPDLVFSTFLGGANSENGRGVATDAAGNVYVVGEATGANFPTTPAAFRTSAGATGSSAFVAKYTPQGAIVYASLLEGSGNEEAYAVDASPAGEAWIVGRTTSTNFPVCGGPTPKCSLTAVRSTLAGGTDGFVAALDAMGANMVYGSYLGGRTPSVGSGATSAFDEALSVAYDPSGGHVTISGRTQAVDFPTNGVQAATYPNKLATATGYDAFLVRLAPLATAPLVYSTYFGGTSEQSGRGVAVDGRSIAYLTGITASGFNTMGPFQASYGGGAYDAMLGVFAKRGPKAVLTASAPGFGSTAAPPATSFTVPARVGVSLTSAASVPGDLPIGSQSWELLDGTTVLATSPGVTPTFSPFTLQAPGVRTVCVTVFDTSTGPSLADYKDKACLTLTFVARPLDELAAKPDEFAALEDTPLVVPAQAGLAINDPGFPNSTIIELQSVPAHGAIAVSANGAFTYTPGANVCNQPGGTADRFRYQLENAQNEYGSPVNVTINIVCVDDPPAFQANATRYDLKSNAAPFSDPFWATLPSTRTAFNTLLGAAFPVPAAIRAGPCITLAGAANECTTQALRFTVANDNPGLFSAAGQPTVVAYASKAWTTAPWSAPGYKPTYGWLNFTLGQDTSGSANLEVCLVDDGITGGLATGPGSDDSSCVTVVVAVPHPPQTQDDLYVAYAGYELKVADVGGVLANDVNGTGVPYPQAPISAQMLVTPAHAAAFQLDTDGGFRYTPAAGYQGPDSFWYRALEGDLASRATLVTIDVRATFPPGADFSWTPAEPVAGQAMRLHDASGVPGAAIVAWSWDLGDGSSSSAQDPSHVYKAPGSYRVTLTIVDSKGARAQVSKVIQVVGSSMRTDQSFQAPPQTVPVADAGPDLVAYAGDLVRLAGAGSPPGLIVAHAWMQVDGPPIQLEGARTDEPSFVAPAVSPDAPVAIVLQLAVSTDEATSVPDTVRITVYAANAAPVAIGRASAQAASLSMVTLDGSESRDADGDPLAFAWQQVAGPPVLLEGANSDRAAFQAPRTVVQVGLEFELTVSDGRHPPSADRIYLTIVPEGAASAAPFGVEQPDKPGTVRFRGGSAAATWDFGDGTTGTGVDPVHVYTRSGTYTVHMVDGNEVQERQVIVDLGDGPAKSVKGAAGLWVGVALVAFVAVAVLAVRRHRRS